MVMETILNKNSVHDALERANEGRVSIHYKYEEDALIEMCEKYLKDKFGIANAKVTASVWDDHDGYGLNYSFNIEEESVSDQDWEKLCSERVYSDECILAKVLNYKFDWALWNDVVVNVYTECIDGKAKEIHSYDVELKCLDLKSLLK